MTGRRSIPGIRNGKQLDLMAIMKQREKRKRVKELNSQCWTLSEPMQVKQQRLRARVEQQANLQSSC
jgi:hypothetical protein